MKEKKEKYKIPVKVPFIFRVIHTLFPVLEKVFPYLANRIIAYVFFTPMRFKPPEKEHAAYEKADKFSLVVNGKKVQAYSWGEGPNVLATHGWSGRATQFRKFIDPFTNAGYRILSFDGPAHGRSEGSDTNITEFHEVIRQLEAQFGPFVASIGHSFGGVANLFASVQGINIPRQIMIATPTIADDIINESVRKLNGSPARAAYLKKYIFERFGVEFEDVSVLRLIEQVDDLPILSIHDGEDREVSLEHPKALLKKYAGARLIETTGLGHIRILKSPEVVEHCLEFIRKE